MPLLPQGPASDAPACTRPGSYGSGGKMMIAKLLTIVLCTLIAMTTTMNRNMVPSPRYVVDDRPLPQPVCCNRLDMYSAASCTFLSAKSRPTVCPSTTGSGWQSS